MPKSLIILLVSLLLAGPAWAQDETGATEPERTGDAGDAGETAVVGNPEEAGEDDADEEADAQSDEPVLVDPEFDDEAIDEQTYEEDDDDFVPSEEIPADEPIPFPSNI